MNQDISQPVNPDILHAWQTNQAVNEVLLAHLTPQMLEAGTPGGGYNVAQHLAHMVECSKGWGMELEPSLLQDLPDLYSNYDPDTGDFDAEMDLERIKAVWRQTRAALLETAQKNATNNGKLPHASPAQLLFHMAVHDAHHRGQILLALKTFGFPLPDDSALWLPLRT
jgi:uncharacterized damage-inducible protein DinB